MNQTLLLFCDFATYSLQSDVLIAVSELHFKVSGLSKSQNFDSVCRFSSRALITTLALIIHFEAHIIFTSIQQAVHHISRTSTRLLMTAEHRKSHDDRIRNDSVEPFPFLIKTNPTLFTDTGHRTPRRIITKPPDNHTGIITSHLQVRRIKVAAQFGIPRANKVPLEVRRSPVSTVTHETF